MPSTASTVQEKRATAKKATFEDLVRMTEGTLKAIEERPQESSLDIKIADIQKKYEEALTIKSEDKRQLALKVLNADLEQIRAEVAKEQEDLAQAVFGLNAMLENMGGEYAHLMELTSEEQALVTTAQMELQGAKTERTEAEGKWSWFGIRDRAIARADERLVSANQGMEDAQVESKKRARARLLSANMEDSLQEFMLRVQKTIQIMTIRKEQIEAQLKNVAARKVAAEKEKFAAAGKIEALDKKLNSKEVDLKEEEEALQSLTNGSPEYATQESKISKLRAEVEEVRGDRNEAFVLYQSKEKFAEELGIHEITQMKLRDNQRMWIASLKSDTEERVVTFRSRLEAMKAASDQEVAKKLDALGQAADINNARYMATVGSASDNIRIEKVKKHAGNLREVVQARAAQAEAIQNIRAQEADLLRQFKERWGIDPMDTSFFRYEGEDGSGNGGNPSGEPSGKPEKEELARAF
jgi:hypothetical protein